MLIFFSSDDGIDLKNLLVGYDDTSSDLSAFIQVIDAGGDVTIKMDKDGTNSFDTADQTIVLSDIGTGAITIESFTLNTDHIYQLVLPG